MSQEHPDLEQLSSRLDGDDGLGAHLEGCGECRARLTALEGVARAVGAPTAPPPADLVDLAVAAALTEWASGSAASSTGAPAGEAAGVVPLRRGTGRTPRPPWAWVAAAAAAIALLVAVPAVLPDGRQGEDSAFRGAGESGQAAAPRGAGDGDSEDLGDHHDPAELAAAVASRFATARPTGSAAPEAAAPRAAPQTSGERSGSAAPPADLTAPMAAAGPCDPEARTVGADRLDELLYWGSLRWKGTPAAVLVYRLREPSPPEVDRQLYVMSVPGCALLAEQRF